MKKAVKSIFCSLLAMLMVLSCTTVAFAKNDVTPVIVVHGVGGSPLYKNIGTDEEAPVASFSIANLVTVYNDLIKTVLNATAGNPVDADDLIDEISDYMQEYIDLACDEDGKPTNNSGIKNYYTDSMANHPDYISGEGSSEPAITHQIADKIGAKNVFAFNYDWRLDVCTTAKKLSTFVDEVKKQTGKSKVTIVGCSEGSAVLSAYIDAYKSKNDIKRAVFLNGAQWGVSVTKLYAQDIHIDSDVVLNYLYDFLNTFNNKDFDISKLSFLTYTMSDSIVSLCDLLNEIADSPKLLKRLYLDVLEPVLGHIPVMWEFIPYDDFDDAVSKMSKIGFLDKKSGMYKQIKKYHGVQGRLKSNLLELKKKGVDIALISNYGIPNYPVISDYDNQTDSLIDTKYTSLGATTAPFGKTLDAKGKYVSPDKEIDASTCVLPDNTWFVKGVRHVDFWYNTEISKFIAEIITTNKKLSISSVKKETGHGQFTGADKEQKIIAVTESTSPAERITKETAKTTAEKSEEKKSPLTGSDSVTALAFSTALCTAALATVVLRKKVK